MPAKKHDKKGLRIKGDRKKHHKRGNKSLRTVKKGALKGVPILNVMDGLLPPTCLSKMKTVQSGFFNSGSTKGALFVQLNNMNTPWDMYTNTGSATYWNNYNVSLLTNATVGSYYPAQYHVLFNANAYQSYIVYGVSYKITAICGGTSDCYHAYAFANTYSTDIQGSAISFIDLQNDPKVNHKVISPAFNPKSNVLKGYFPLHEYYGISKDQLLSQESTFSLNYANATYPTGQLPLALVFCMLTADNANTAQNAGWEVEVTYHFQAISLPFDRMATY